MGGKENRVLYLTGNINSLFIMIKHKIYLVLGSEITYNLFCQILA